ncbi:MAG: hypothetical protein P1P76_12420 [Anaerolineales bacterium]|nr:hypothetical protein [Anaerolineales bacterium]
MSIDRISDGPGGTAPGFFSTGSQPYSLSEAFTTLIRFDGLFTQAVGGDKQPEEFLHA